MRVAHCIGSDCLRCRPQNWLFAGFDTGGKHAATIYTILETAKMDGLEPQAYLRDIITHIADHPIKRIAERLPWNVRQ